MEGPSVPGSGSPYLTLGLTRWRTLGLFAAADDGQLEEVLASMPLRVWRTDEVTPLGPHPNDPGAGRDLQETGAEFLTTFTTAIPQGTPGQAVDDAQAREAERAHELAGQGHLVRLWVLPGRERALGLWRAQDPAEIQAILESLPLYPWMTVQTAPLTAHPSDPALANRLKIVRSLGPRSLGVDLRPGQRPSRRAGQLR